MINFPKILHQIHLFEEEGVHYAADFDKGHLVKISAVIADILKRANTHTNETITSALKTSYPENEINKAFEKLENFEKQGLLFNRGENLEWSISAESERRKVLVVIPGTP